MPLDHVSIGVTEMRKAKAFYDAVLKTLGWSVVEPLEMNGQLVGVGYGDDGFPRFWIQLPINGRPATMGNGVHIAFSAKSRREVDDFYLAAIEKGGADDGKPGLRTEYHPDYYGAFVRDPDGNKIEAAVHTPE